MARQKKKATEINEPDSQAVEMSVSVLDITESDVPQMGIGEVIEEEIQPWDDEVRLAEEKMVGDMSMMVLDRIKTLPRAWSAMTPNQQQDVVSSVIAGCEVVVKQAIEAIASKGRKIITGIMKQVTIKDEISMTITCQRSPEACAAMGMAAAGGTVAFLLLETEGLLALGDPIQVGPVQGVLNLDGSDETACSDENTECADVVDSTHEQPTEEECPV